MKLVLHHFLKDVRHLRWMLGIWLLIVLIQNVADFLAVQPNYQVANKAETTMMIWYLLNGITWMALIIVAIQSEPVTGGTSFWLTRPIPPLIYVLGKAILILGLVFAPMLATKRIDLWLFDVNAAAANATLLNLLATESAFSIVVLWLATYTRTLLQFFGVVVIVLLLVETISIACSTLWIAHYETDPNLLNSRALVAVCIFFGGLMVSLIAQYGLRRTRAAFVLGTMSILLTILASQWWPFVLPWGSWPPKIPGAVHLAYRLDATKPLYWNDQGQNYVTYKTANASLIAPASTIEGIPFVQLVQSSFQPEGGTTIPLPAWFGTSGQIDNNSLDWGSQLHLDNPDLKISGSPTSASTRSLFMLTPQLAQRLNDQTGTLSLKISGKFVSLHKCTEMPLEETAYARIPDALLRISAIQATHSIQVMGGTQSQGARSGIDLSVREVGYVDSQIWAFLPTVYLLVDKKKRTGLILTKQLSSSQMNSGGPLCRTSTQVTMHASVNFSDSSMDDLVLYVYEESVGPAFDSEIAVPNYTMHPGDNSFGGDYADVTATKIETTATGYVSATLLVVPATQKPIIAAFYDGKTYRGGGNLQGGREGYPIASTMGFILNPEGTPATKNIAEAPWSKRLLIHNGDKRRLKPGDRWYFDDFLTADGVRHYGYIEVQK